MPKIAHYFKAWEHFSHEIRQDCLDLLAVCLNKQRSELFLLQDQSLTESQNEQLNQWVELRLSGHPFAYITKNVLFFGCSLKISPDVLIPRPETELLVEKTLGLLSERPYCKVVLDLCSGSGCIGLAIKKHRPDLKVILSDISEAACDVARSNAFANKLDIEVRSGDFLKTVLPHSLDFIICNPPYLSKNEYDLLGPSVKNYEPKMALLSGETGLEFYERLKKEAPFFLKSRGLLALEIGSTQGKSVKEIFSQSPWSVLSLEKDYASLDRFFFVEIEA